MLLRLISVIGYPSVRSVWDCNNYIRVGPNKWLISNLENCNRCRSYYEDWNSLLSSEDSVLAVGGWYIDSSVYLCSNAEISHYSVMCNPTYNEKLLEYWKNNPSKEPEIIAISGYMGNQDPSPDSWIITYVNEHYIFCKQGEYWTFYKHI